ncbi:hypothetical protein [Streptomyces clavuligerus]|nr:hypothetical protein [Streptomyces clavuligerus]ANW18055.1 hypothetical protein BB341_07370 [Streptomyces clavuligerus]AXU12615.1 hypothetical protein D1794_07650 [Streptomyces clavuligerus]EDY47030.1 conserved membrane protein [Streptomyces clavuligerus]MBY6302515.1 hypothetical protein [Streptomyces clavuligerus]QCS05396.1 hypothetical protein CRV15_07080 [Streptomyces clavuligerus]
MVLALIIICEVGFWVLLAAGLGARYVLRRPRLGMALLLCEPLLEVVLLAATAIDLRNGAEPSWHHGLAALYIGYTVGHGHRTVTWLDGHAAHRFGGAPPPPEPPRYGKARAAHEGKLWAGTVVGAVVASGLLLLAILYVGDAARTASLEAWLLQAWKITGIHGLIALTYVIWPRRAPAGSGDGNDEGDGSDGSGGEDAPRVPVKVERRR